MTHNRKPIAFEGSSLDDLRAFPNEARNQAGYQLDRVQQGSMPDDFKPLKEVGAGVYEVRVRTGDGAFRVVYVARFEEAVYVLHAFQKKTRKTAPQDLDTAARRYRALVQRRG